MNRVGRDPRTIPEHATSQQLDSLPRSEIVMVLALDILWDVAASSRLSTFSALPLIRRNSAMVR
jgi:hypothetical protein